MAAESIYLCYALADRALSDALGQALRDAGRIVAPDEAADEAAESLIPPALEGATTCIIILSQEALRSPRLRQQARWFVGARARDASKRLLVLWRESLPAEQVWVFLRPFPVISGGLFATLTPEQLIALTRQALDDQPEETVPAIQPSASLVRGLPPPVTAWAPTPAAVPVPQRGRGRIIPIVIMVILLAVGGVFAFTRSPSTLSATRALAPTVTFPTSATMGEPGATALPSATVAPTPTAAPSGSVPPTATTVGASPTPFVIPPPPVVPDAGFETPFLGANNYQYTPPGGAWSYSEGAGLAGNNSGFTNGNPNAPEGTQVGVLQYTGSISQNITGFQAGVRYILTIAAAQRGGVNSERGQNFTVTLDGTVLNTIRPNDSAYVDISFSFTTTTGSHILAFTGLDAGGGDNTAFIDNVRITD